MKAALPRLPATLRAQMEAVPGRWQQDQRRALVLLGAQIAAAERQCQWLLVDSLCAARRAVMQQLQERAEADITEGTRMAWAHVTWDLPSAPAQPAAQAVPA